MRAQYKIGERIELDPAGLIPLPAVAAMHRCAKGSDEFERRCASFRERGQIDDIQITEFGEVIDGETTRQICQSIGIKIWAKVFPKSDWFGVAVDSMMMSRDWNGYQRAFGLYPLFREEMCEKDALSKRFFSMSNEEKKACSKEFVSQAKRVGELAHKLRVNTEYMRISHELHMLFDEDGDVAYEWTSEDAIKRLKELGWDTKRRYTLRQYFTACILDLEAEDRISLGAAYAGARDKYYQRLEAEGGNPRGRSDKITSDDLDADGQMRLWKKVLVDGENRLIGWNSEENEARRKALIEFAKKQAAGLAIEQRAALHEYHRRMANIFKVKTKKS